MARPEGEPTTHIIFHNGRNGALKPEFGGVAIDSVFNGSEYVPRDQSKIEEILKEQKRRSQKPLGGVVGGVGGSVLDTNIMQYVPIEKLKP